MDAVTTLDVDLRNARAGAATAERLISAALDWAERHLDDDQLADLLRELAATQEPA